MELELTYQEFRKLLICLGVAANEGFYILQSLKEQILIRIEENSPRFDEFKENVITLKTIYEQGMNKGECSYDRI